MMKWICRNKNAKQLFVTSRLCIHKMIILFLTQTGTLKKQKCQFLQALISVQNVGGEWKFHLSLKLVYYHLASEGNEYKYIVLLIWNYFEPEQLRNRTGHWDNLNIVGLSWLNKNVWSLYAYNSNLVSTIWFPRTGLFNTVHLD